MNIKKHIPNIITLANLFCGCIAIVFIANLDFEMAFYFVCLGIFFDFFDGFFARKFFVSGPLGVQLDSLADMVTSGVVPGFMMYKMLPSFSDINNYNDNISDCFPLIKNNPSALLPYLGFIITLGACYRLAKFNIDTRQSDSFIGLPTPANTLFIMSLPLINNGTFISINLNQWVLIAISFLSAFIMNAEIPLFSLKIKSKNLKDNLLQIIFLLTSVILISIFKFLGVAIVILFYVLLSVVMNIFSKKTSS
jgi:CDP-diacylglycerol---serine O-phosphatidyltransferase